jgi:two-component system NtrC family sensor kinase
MRAVETKQHTAGKLREELNLKALLLDAATDSIFLYRPDGTLIYVNETACKSRGYSKEELMAMNGWELAIPELAHLFNSQVKEIINEGEATFESAHLCKDGTSMLVETHSRTIRVNSEDLILSVCRNVTKRKQAEELATTLIHSAQIGVYIVQDGKFEIINPQIMKVLGLSQEQLLGKDALTLVHPEDKARVRENAIKMLKGKRLEPYEFRVFDSKGNVRIVMEAVAPITYKGKRAVLGNFMDVTEAKQAEELYRTLAKSSPVGVYIVQDGKFQFVNPQFQKYTGFSEDELLGRESLELVHPEDRDRVRENAVAMLKGNRFPPYELRYIVKGGETLWATETVTSIYYNGKRAVLGNFMDITAHKQAEEKLQESEEYLKTLFNASTGGMLVIDPETHKIVDANPAIIKMIGVEREQIIGRVCHKFVCPADVGKCPITDLQQKVDTSERVLLKASGGKAPILKSVVPITRHGRQYLLELIIDITARKQAEEALRESREQLRKMFESVTDGISVIDLNGAITEVNQRMVEIHAFGSKEELVGKKAFELVSPRDHERIAANMREAIKQGTVGSMEYTLLKANGTEFPAELSTSVLRDALGNPAGHITIVRDITERKVMQEQLMLTDRLASIGELASGIAHELNNPLTSIIGFSQLLMEKDIADDSKEDLKLVHSEAQRAAGIVKNLLTFARKHAPVKQLTQINSIIEDVLRLRAYEQKVNNIEVVKQFDPALPEIMVDHFLIRQVFLNLVINAEYFMTEAHKKGALTLTTKKVDNTVTVSFTDDGPGISRENLSRIFSPFFTTKEVGKGTGLGLSICHGIVAEHGGNIHARSQLGKGATFVVELPIINS